MNEQAIQDAYQLFTQAGYKKSINDFKTLMSTNEQARKDAFDLFVSNGYKKSIEDFGNLMGVKKKESAQGVSPLVASPSTSASSGEIAGGFADVVKKTQPLQKPTAKTKPTTQVISASSFATPLATIAQQDVNVPKKESDLGTFENLANNFLNGAERLIQQDAAFLTRGVMAGRGVPIETADAMGEVAKASIASKLKADRKTKTREQMGLFEESVAAFAQSAPVMLSSIATGTAGANVAGKLGMKALGSLPMFISGYESGIEEATQAGITDPLVKHTFASVTAGIEAGSELIGMPDAQLIKPLKKKLIKEVIEQGTKGLTSKQIGTYIAEAATKVAAEVGEEYAVEFGNFLRDYSFHLAGYGDAPEMKSARDYAVIGLSAAIGGGAITGVGTSFDIANAKNAAIVNAAENIEQATAATAELVEAGVLTQAQADDFIQKASSVAAAKGKMPRNVDADVAVNTAPLVEQIAAIDEQIAALEIEKASVLDSFHEPINQQIAQLQQQKQDLDAQIKSAITPQAEATTTQEAGTAEGAVGVADTEGGAGVSGVGIQEPQGVEALIGKRGAFTDANGNLVEGDVYMDGQRVVVESNGKIYDIFGTLEELGQMEQLPITEAQPRFQREADGSFVYNSDMDAMPIGTKVTPQGSGLKAVKRDKQGKVKSVVVTAADGKTYNLKGEDAQALAFEMMLDEIDKGNFDAKIVLDETATRKINTAAARPIAGQAERVSGQTQADATKQGDGGAARTTTKRDGGTVNEKAKQEPKEGLLAGVRGDRPQDEGRKESPELRTKKEKVGGKDANEKPSTEKVSVGEQPETGEGVRGQDAKGKEATEKSEAKKRIEAAKEKRKEAIEKIKQQFRDAKNTGISFDFEKKMKEDKEFFGALRDIVRTNLEIGVLSFAENVSDVASIIGQELDAKAKKALRKLYGQEAIAELKRTKKAELDLEDIRQAVTDYIEDNKKVLDEVANAKVTRLVNEVKTEGGVNQLIKYVEKLVESKEFRTQVKDAAKGLDAAISKLKGVAGGEQIISLIESIRVAGVDKVELLTKMANLLNVDPTTPKRIEQVRKDASELLNEVNDFFSKKAQDSMPKTFAEMEKAMDDSLTERVLNEEKGEYEKKPKKFDSARKIRNFVNKIGDFKEQVLMLQGLGAITDAEAAVLVERIENMQGMADEAVTNLKEKIAEETTAATMQSRKIVSGFQDDGSVGYSTLIKPLKEALDNIKDLSFSQAVRLQRFLEDAQNGYYALSAYRDIVSPIIDKQKIEAANEFVDKASEARGRRDWKIASNLPDSMRSFMRSTDAVRRKVETTVSALMDDIFGNAQQGTWLKNFLTPFQRSTEVYEDAVKKFNREFDKLISDNQVKRIFGVDGLFKNMSDYKNAMTRVGYYMAARRYPDRNILKEQMQLISDGATGLTDSQKGILVGLSEKYKDGVIPESELTAKEKKVVKALDTLYTKLAKFQAEVNLMRGQDFMASDVYYPFMALDFSNLGKEQTGLHDSEQEVYSASNEALAFQAEDKRNPKIRSDRGLQANPNASPFLIDPNADATFRKATDQVFKDRFLFPEVYAAMKSFNASKGVDNAFAEIALNRYRNMVRSYVSTGGVKLIENIVKAKQIEILTRPIRYVLEPLSGAIMYGSVPNLGYRSMTKNIMQAAALSLKSGYKNLLEIGSEGRYEKINEFEETLLDNLSDSTKEVAAYLTSPDAVNDSTFRRAAFVGTMKRRFKEITGKDMNVSAAAYDKDYISQNKEALKQASDEAYGIVYAKYYPKSGKINMPTKVMRVRLFGLLGKDGVVLDKARSKGEATMAQMLFLFGSWQYRTGQLFRARMSDAALDTNHGRAVAFKTLAATMASTAAYQYGKQALLTIGSVAAIRALLRTGDEGEDEELVRIEAAFNRIRSFQYGLGQTMSAFIYMLTSQSGALGKAGILLGGYVINKQIEERMKEKGADVAELNRLQANVANAVKDATFRNVPANERQLNDALITTSSGGFPMFLESVGSFGAALSNVASDPISKEGAENLAYALGSVYNAFLSQRTGVPFPFLGAIKNEKIDEMATKDMSLEQLKKKLSRDKNYRKSIFEDLAYEAAWKAKDAGTDKSFMLKKIEEGEARKVSPLVEAYEKAIKAFPEEAKTEEGRADIADKLTKAFEKMLYPVSFIKMKNISDPFEEGSNFGDRYVELSNMLDGDISEETAQRLKFELDLIADYAESNKSKEFKRGYDERTRTK